MRSRVTPLALSALRATLTFDLFKPLAGALDGLADHPAVQFDLRFTRAAACADAALLALQVRPAPHQPRGLVLQPGQFHLQLAFVAPGALGKYLKNQKRAVIDWKLQMALQIALLTRAQTLVKQNFNRAKLGRQQFDFIRLPASDKQSGVWRFSLTRNARDWIQASTLRQ